VTFEARLIFVLLFFALWSFLGFLPWSFAAVIRRGRHVLLALPLALAAASLAGVLVPLLGARDETGFLLSIATALLGGVLGTVAGILLAVRISPTAAKQDASNDG
jgi:flagellar biosynthesis protein FliR